MTSKGKGNDFEWVTARALSLWLTGGEDKTQLIRSVQSGGHEGLRSISATKPQYQVGDLAPNGPQGEWFRDSFGIECKAYKGDPDWWHAITYENWIVEQWWHKINYECSEGGLRLQPLLIMRRNGRPVVVMVRNTLLNAVVGVSASLIIPALKASVITFDVFRELKPLDWIHAARLASGR